MVHGKLSIEDFLARQKKVFLRLFSVYYPMVVRGHFSYGCKSYPSTSTCCSCAARASKKIIDQFPDERLGRFRGELTTKIHCLSDELGNPVELILTGGRVHDSQCAEALLDGKKTNFVIANKAYDNKTTLKRIEQMGGIAINPFC